MVLLLVGAVLSGAAAAAAGDATPVMVPEGKRVLLVLDRKEFSATEHEVVQDVLENWGAEVKVASTVSGPLENGQGGEAIADMTLDQVDPERFDAVVFIGSDGRMPLRRDETARRIAREAMEHGKVLAAGGYGMLVPAEAGVLRGLRCPNGLSEAAETVLEREGCTIQRGDLVVDGRVVLAVGYQGVYDMAGEVLRLLSE